MFLSQFYFEIQYRKGADHVNADYMSRYVLMAEEDNAEKSLDPYFNKPLEEDIRFKNIVTTSRRKLRVELKELVKNMIGMGQLLSLREMRNGLF